MKNLNQSGDKTMETLIKIVKCIDGYEKHYRVEGSSQIKIEFVIRPLAKKGK